MEAIGEETARERKELRRRPMPLLSRPHVVGLQTDAGERLIGRVVPAADISATLRNLGAEMEGEAVAPADLFERILGGGRAKLANGWTLKSSLVAGERRIELVGPASFSEGEEVKKDGVFTERIAYTTRYFVPATAEEGARVLAAVTRFRPVVEVTGGEAYSVKAPRSGEPVARISGDELGVAFRGPDDMPALRSAAQAWYKANLLGTTAMTADGRTVMFSDRGLRKSTGPKATDELLRAVPAIRQIIERGKIVHTAAGTIRGVVEHVIIAAPVELLGAVRTLAVSIQRYSSGTYHYNLSFGRDDGSPGVGVPGGQPVTAPVKSAVAVADEAGPPSGADIGEAPQSTPIAALNLFDWPAGFKNAERTDVVAALRAAPAVGSMVDALVASGRLVIDAAAPEGAPAGAQGWTAPDGTIHLVAPALNAAHAAAALLHEAFHGGVRRLIGSKAWTDLLSRLDALHRRFEKGGAGARRFFDAARERVGAAGVRDSMTAEEFGAYAIEEYELAPRLLRNWVDDLLGAIKAWLLRRFGRQIGQVTPAELRSP